MQQEYLIGASSEGGAGSASKGRRQQQHGAGGAWKRKKTRSLMGSNRLMEKFSKFLATRNVINDSCTNDQSPGHHCYDKLVSQSSDDLSLIRSLNNYHDDSADRFSCGQDNIQQISKQTSKQTKKFETAISKQQQLASSSSSRQRSTRRGRRRRNDSGSECGGKHAQQHGTVWMLAALFSPTSKSSRRSLLFDLIRAPTLLAALFSSLLVVTLIVFYALSFSHHHQAITQNSRRTNASASSSSFVVSRDDDDENLTTLSRGHRISGRDLPANLKRQPEYTKQFHEDEGEGDDDDDDDDDETMEDYGEEKELPAGLSRALSVQTECGSLMGSAEDTGVVFRGIPYASPPIGARRWQRPQPIWLDSKLCSNSTGEQDATTSMSNELASGRKSRQRQTSSASHIEKTTKDKERRRAARRRRRRHCAQLNPITNRFAGQEDCLYLDIYLPRLERTKRLPVMVYIHGGFLAFGSSSGQLNWMKARPSARLAAELDVIVVAFNYRLQALGFMTLPQLVPGSATSSSGGGNFGLWDQLTALNWIKRNIESFGGDPNNIVLFGPDSASSLVWALVGNRYQAQSGMSRSSPGAQLRNLFRAAWLTNPTIFYDLPYELAGQHYQRLFQNQSACLAESAKSQRSSFSSISGEHTNEGNGSQSTIAQLLHGSSPERQDNLLLKDCLMQLSAEQVMRHYLGDDHPSYRLDDQNSLPIHGIFVDQFVTIDGELVRDSFPFMAGSSDSASATSISEEIQAEPNSETYLPKSSSRQANKTSHYAKGSSIETNEIRRVHNNSTSIDKEAAFSSNCSHRDDDLVAPIRVSTNTIELLIGSSAQAVEHWPCPRNLNQWTWDDFKRYVATSLNSFATDLYRRASSLYDVPKFSNKANINKHQSSASPAWTYLTMVSDIRQICPISELADTLRLEEAKKGPNGNGLSVYRYIVESSQTMSTKEHSSDAGHRTTTKADESSPTRDHYANLNYMPSGRPKFAHHTKDLAAFFGYEFDPTFEPQTGDLKFQTKIRQMVRQFVHKQTPANNEADHGGNKIAILDENGATRYVDKYKHNECSMWRRHLGKSYAWVS